eukprot:CAMPEP_0174919526 /NCGR_PEP_ID=MMETSP1355-20121228/3719_1 /TAXON_ID=464990 /ORGANISM="Hemiselmis tepida, Strain CCMP443" /LENGTH=556 /DNA_ID=CAMNT_0016164757 /DNA_START=56 /DNA_END=1723 /DNA_ORIENTATION=+
MDDNMIPKARVRFSISCSKLRNKDTLSKSDPMVIVNVRSGNNNDFEYVGRTEWQRDNLNPTFNHKIDMDYTFETKQMLRFIVIDVDDPNKVPEKYVPHSKEGDLLGMGEVLMSTLMGSRNQTATMKLTGQKPGKDYGTVTINAEQMADDARPDDALVFHLFGRDLAKKDGPLGKSDPFLVLSRTTLQGQKQEVFKTEVVKSDLNPSWKPIRVNMIRLCNGDLDAKFHVACYDWDRLSSNDLIGEVDCCVQDLLDGKTLILVDPSKPDKNVGSLGCDKATILRLPSFLDYLTEGVDLYLNVGVDFTLSNGESSDPTSLHYADPTGAWNAYQESIIAVGEVLLPYDKDGKVAALGYGGIPSGEKAANFCFALNGNESAPEVQGVQGVLDAYASGIKSVKLHGPTNLAPLIERAGMIAKETSRRSYQVLMIMTDGEITDMVKTVDAIVASSELPMSIVIVGVGNEHHPMEFANMKILDGDEKGLVDSNCRAAQRDIVQFVPFCHGRGMSQAQLAKAVLHEIPMQMVQHYVARGVKPKAWQGTHFDMLPVQEALAAVANE